MSRSKIIAAGIRNDAVITHGKNCLIIKKFEKGKRIFYKKVLEIKKEQTKNYKLIGKAHGMNLFHCLYLASKYSANFNDRVAAYCIVKPTKKMGNFAIAFYEKKQKNS